jgi:hypothetical protein
MGEQQRGREHGGSMWGTWGSMGEQRGRERSSREGGREHGGREQNNKKPALVRHGGG